MSRPGLLVYDVRDDRRREGVRAVLRPVADWIQQSAWVVRPGVEPEALLMGLDRYLQPGDRVRLYRPCPSCLRGAVWAPSDPAPFSWYRTGLILIAKERNSAGWLALP